MTYNSILGSVIEVHAHQFLGLIGDVIMFNTFDKRVTCDVEGCHAKVGVKGANRTALMNEIGVTGWEYLGLSQYCCPKCAKKTHRKLKSL
jgi:hypothetical protein